MTFLNAAMAVGAAAFVVPLLIHLLYRTRVKPVRWGAMHLLSDVVISNRRQVRVTNWVLLAIRCAIPILLALALARPLIEAMAASSSDDRRGLILVIDNSASMAATSNDSQSMWLRAKKVATDLLGTARRSDPIVILASFDPDADSSSDVLEVGGVSDARRRLDQIEPIGPATNLAAMAQIGIRAASMIDASSASIVLVTDGAAATIDSMISDQSRAIAATLAERDQWDASVISVGVETESSPRNVWIGPIEIETPISLSGRQTDWSTTIENQTDQPIRDGNLRIVLGENEILNQSVSIDARSQSRVRWQTPAASRGLETMSVQIDSPDDFAIDNFQTIVFETTDPMPAIIVDDSRQRELTARAGGFLSLALTPFRSGQQDAIVSNVVESSALLQLLQNNVDQSESEPLAAIFFTDNIVWQDDWIEPIQDFMRRGGQCIVLAGEHDASPGNGAEFLRANANLMQLPAAIGGIMNLQRDQPTQTRFATGSPWSSLGFEEGVELQIGKLRNLERLDLPDNADQDAGVSQTWWLTQSGTPLAMTRRIGRGRLVQFAIPANSSWSNWPLRPAMLPMLQSLLLDQSLTRFVRSQIVGETVTLRAPKSMSNFDGDRSAAPLRWVQPDGRTYPAIVQSSGDASTRAIQLGTLRLTNQNNDSATDMDDSFGDNSLTIVSMDPAESDLRAAGAEAVQTAAEQLGAKFVTNVDEYQSGQLVLRDGREIWRPLIWALLALMIGELIWQQRSRRRAASMPSRPIAASVRP